MIQKESVSLSQSLSRKSLTQSQFQIKIRKKNQSPSRRPLLQTRSRSPHNRRKTITLFPSERVVRLAVPMAISMLVAPRVDLGLPVAGAISVHDFPGMCV